MVVITSINLTSEQVDASAYKCFCQAWSATGGTLKSRTATIELACKFNLCRIDDRRRRLAAHRCDAELTFSCSREKQLLKKDLSFNRITSAESRIECVLICRLKVNSFAMYLLKELNYRIISGLLALTGHGRARRQREYFPFGCNVDWRHSNERIIIIIIVVVVRTDKENNRVRRRKNPLMVDLLYSLRCRIIKRTERHRERKLPRVEHMFVH